MPLHEEKVQAKNDGRNGGKDRNVKTKEPRQSRSRHLIPSTEEAQQERSDRRDDSGDVGPNLGGKVGQLVPRKQIAAEAEGQRKKQQESAGDPGQFARAPEGPEEKRAEHMDERCGDHEIGRPAGDRTDQPAKLHLGHDELNAFESGLRAGTVVKKEQNAGADLNHEEKEGHSPKVIPEGMAVTRNLFVVDLGLERAPTQSLFRPFGQRMYPAAGHVILALL